MSEHIEPGDRNSSITRVWPVFLQLLDQDPADEGWLRDLLVFVGQTSDLASQMSKSDCVLAHDLRRERLSSRYRPAIRLPRCLEYDAPAPERFLQWLIRHPEQLNWGALASSSDPISETEMRRKQLRAGDQETIAVALENLALLGSRDSARRWWVFEGPTSIDCFIETQDFVIAIEGKRTEGGPSPSTSWFKQRDQIARNLEVVQSLACGRRYGALLVVENESELSTADHGSLAKYIAPSLPHYDTNESDFLASHFLGSITWRQLCTATRLNFDSLPERSGDFYRAYASRLVVE